MWYGRKGVDLSIDLSRGNIEKTEQNIEDRKEYAKRLNSIQLDDSEMLKIDEIVCEVEDEELQDLLRSLFIKQTKFYKLETEKNIL